MSGHVLTAALGGLLIALVDWALVHVPAGWRRDRIV